MNIPIWVLIIGVLALVAFILVWNRKSSTPPTVPALPTPTPKTGWPKWAKKIMWAGITAVVGLGLKQLFSNVWPTETSAALDWTGTNLLFVFNIIGIAVCWLFLFIGGGFVLAQFDMGWFAKNPTGKIGAYEKNGTVYKIVPNIPNASYDEVADVLTEVLGENPITKISAFWPMSLIENWLGLYFISFVWPFKGLKRWKFKTMHPQKMDGGGYELCSAEKFVSYLSYQETHPILASDVELKRQVKVSVIIRVIYRIRKPMYILGIMNGDWFGQASSETAGLIENMILGKDITEFQQMDKSEFKKKLNGQLLVKDSVEILSASYVESSPDDNGQAIIDALQAAEVAEARGNAKIIEETKGAEAKLKAAEIGVNIADKTAEARVKTAMGEKKARILQGEGEKEARSLEGAGDAVAIGARYEEAAKHVEGLRTVRVEAVAKAVENFKGKTLVTGGSSGTLLNVENGGES